MAVRSVPVPDSPLAAGTLPRVDFADAYAAPLPPGGDPDPEVWLRRVFDSPPRWVAAAMLARNALVRPFGLKAPRDTRAGFPVLARAEREVLAGLDDRHLDFRVSVTTHDDRLVVATRVFVRNALGHAYFAPVRLVHPFVVRALIARALSRRG